MCILPLVLDDENLSALVIAAARANGMRKLDLAALRANGTRSRLAYVVGRTTRMGPHPACFTLRYCHRLKPF